MKFLSTMITTLLLFSIPLFYTIIYQNPEPRQIVLDSDAKFLAIGDGSAWVWNSTDQALQEINLSTGQLTETWISLEIEPLIGSVELKSLWICSQLRDRLIRVDLENNTVAATIDIDPFFEEWEFVNVVTGEGTVWIKGEEMMLQIDPEANTVLGEPILAGEEILVAGVAGGELWVGSHDDGLITRIDIQTQEIVAQFDVGFSIHGLAVSEDGIWVLDEHGFAIVQVDPDSNAIIAHIPIDFVASNIGILDDQVWVAPVAYDNGRPIENGTVVRIDPVTQDVAEQVQVGGFQSTPDDYYLVMVEDGQAWAWVVNQPSMLMQLSD